MSLSSSLMNKHLSNHFNAKTLFTLHFTSDRKLMSVLLRDVDK